MAVVRRDAAVTGGVLMAVCASVGWYVNATASALTAAAGGGVPAPTYRLVHIMKPPGIAAWLWSAAAVLLLWGAASIIQTAMGARPTGLVWHADARAFLVYLALIADLWRFFPGPWVRFLPLDPAALIASRVVTLAVLTALSGFARKRQFKAIVTRSVRHVPGMRSVTVPALATVIVAPLLTAAVPVWNDDAASVGERAETVTVSRGIRKRSLWAAGLEFRWNIPSGGAVRLPAGRYRITILEPPDLSGFVVSSPVLVDPIRAHGSTVELRLPLSTVHLKIAAGNQVPGGSGVVRDTPEKNLLISVKPLDDTPLPPGWSQYWPVSPDPRFHEIPLPKPWNAWLYRLDTNSFSMEPNGFWCKGGTRSKWLIMSRYPLKYFQIKIRSAAAGYVEMKNGANHWRRRMDQDQTIDIGWIPEPLPVPESWRGPWVYVFETGTENGIKPRDIHPESRDNRFLGVFIDFTFGDIDPVWISAVLGDDRALFRELPDVLRQLRADPWADWLEYLKQTENKEQTSVDNSDMSTDRLINLVRHRPKNLESLQNAVPATLSVPMRNRLIQRMKAVDYTCDSDRLERERQTETAAAISCFEPPEKRTSMVFGNCLVLDGYRLDLHDETVLLETWWHLKRPIDRNVRMFIHLVPAGETVAGKLFRVLKERISGERLHINGDHDFFESVYPPVVWTPTVVYRDRFALPIPSGLSGKSCDIFIGVYDPRTGRRWTSATDRDGFLISGIELR